MAQKTDSDGTFGFDELGGMLNPKWFEWNFKRIFTKAHNRTGAKFQQMARDFIVTDKVYTANALSTILRKGSSTPLVDKGNLVGSITWNVDDHLTVQLGVNSPRLSSGRFLYEVLHNGATIRRGNSTWTIPARPFLQRVWTDPDFIQFMQDNYNAALEAAFEQGLRQAGGRP